MKSLRTAPIATLLLAALTLIAGCGDLPILGGDAGTPTGGYANVTDATNGNAAFVGSTACSQCHAAYAEIYAPHRHNYLLTPSTGSAPQFPNAATAPTVQPPASLTWGDVSYVVGGYIKPAIFLDRDGFVITTGSTGAAAQWDTNLPPIGLTAGLVDYRADLAARPAFDYDLFRHLATGAVAFDTAVGHRQDNRPGIGGTWSEAGVHCEACHGPGSNHFFGLTRQAIVEKSRIYVDSRGTQTCNTCHARGVGAAAKEIYASDGFVLPFQQAAELQASGAHAGFACTFCHDPHRSVFAEPEAAIRNKCQVCHPDVTPGAHTGKTYRRSDGYTEVISCQSCHMPYAARWLGTAPVAIATPQGRVGDTRTHIFRIDAPTIDVPARDYRSFFTDDGTQVRRDAQGRAAVTVDFVCLRCHNGDGVFAMTFARAAEIAPNIHKLP